MERMKIHLILLLSLLVATSLLATSGARAGAANGGPIPPSITVSEAVGTKPGTVYTAGQTQRTVNVAWNAGSDYPYCEIYYTVNNANQTELGRGHDGAKPLTVKAGSTYALWMVVYLGAQGRDVRTVTEFTVVGDQGNPPSSPGGGGGLVFSDTEKNRDWAYLLAISNVRVEPGARHVMIRFHGPRNQVPFVAIGRAAPVMKDGERVFGDNLVGGGFVGATTSAAEKAKGEYTFSSAASTTNISNGLEPGATYYYNIIIPAGAGRQPYQDTDKFTMLPEAADATLPPIGGGGGGPFTARCPQGQLLAGFELRTGDDVDAIRPLCVTPYGPADVGPREPYANKFGGDGGGIRQLVCPRNAPIVIGMYVYAVGVTVIVDGIHLFCGTAATQRPSDNQSNVPAAVFDGSGGKRGSGLAAGFAGEESDTQRCPAGLVAVGINGRSGVWLDAVGLICGAPTLTPGSSENTGTSSSALTREPPPAKLGRVKVDAPTDAPAGPPRPICEVAREARARNSPAAAGLEAQCRAAGAAGEVSVDLNDLAVKGEAIANQDPLAVELRNRQAEGPARRGFDIGMAAAEGQTAPGPAKQRIHDSLSPEQQGGFDTAVAFSLERNRNADLAAKGAAIAAADPVVAEARAAEADVFFWLGFDIATGIFGDPALGARGNTATGPGSLKIRDSLSAAGQRGFNAAVKLHLSRNYKP